MHGRISSTLPYHTHADPTCILPLFTTQIQVIPNQSIHPTAAQCFTLALLKPFITLPITHPNLSCQALPNSSYLFKCEISYSMVEWDGVGLHNDHELLTGMLHVLYIIS